MKAPTLEEAIAELKALHRVNPDCETVSVNLQHYIGLIYEYIDLVKSVRTSAQTRKK